MDAQVTINRPKQKRRTRKDDAAPHVHAHVHAAAVPNRVSVRMDSKRSHPLLPALGSRQLSRHALLHLPAVRHDGLQDGDGAGTHGPPLLVASRDPGLKIPLKSQKRVGQVVVAISLLKKHLLPLSLETKEEARLISEFWALIGLSRCVSPFH